MFECFRKQKYKFGFGSRRKLKTCHPKIQEWLNGAIKNSPMDFSIICGSRTKDAQNRAFDEGKSQLRYPHSKHNLKSSIAVDLVPYPVDWNDIDRFKKLAKYLKSVAKKLNIDITWGGNWASFKDYPHWELI